MSTLPLIPSRRATSAPTAEAPTANGPGFRIEHVLDRLPVAAYTCDAEGLITYYNEQAVRLWGRSPRLREACDRFCGSFRLFAMDGSPIRHDECWMARALQTNQEYLSQEIVIERSDGTRRTALAHASPIHDEPGRIVGAVNVLIDITHRREIEEKLRTSEKREHARAAELQALVEAVPAVVFIAEDPQCRVIRANRAGYELLRLAPGTNASKTAPDGQAPVHFRVCRNGVEVPAHDLPMQRAARGQQVNGDEVTHCFEDGTHCHLVGNAIPLRDEAGQARGAVGAFLDITARKLMEQKLRDSEERYRTVTELMPAAVYMCGAPGGRIVFFNRRAVQLWGRQPALDDTNERFCGAYRLYNADGSPLPHDRTPMAAALCGGPAVRNREVILERPDGSRIHVSVNIDPVHNASGELVGAINVFQDITDLKQAERALLDLTCELEQRVAERTAALEHRTRQLRRLAAELTTAEHRERRRLAAVLHDHLQQLLVASKMRVDMAIHATSDREQPMLAEAARLIGESIAASRSLTTELCPPVLYEGGLGPALQWLGRWMKQHHELDVRVDLRAEVEAADDHTRALLFEAVRELLFNIVKHAGVDRAQVSLDHAEKGMLAIQVIDEGAGFEDCDGYDSRHSPGGFGLFSARERLVAVGGRLTIRSNRGQGTCVTVYAPRLASPPEGSSSRTAPATLPRRLSQGPPNDDPAAQVITVILADDHQIVREGVANLLARDNRIRIVAQASDGYQAVERVRSLRPQVVVMDVNMPRMNGIEATRVICREFPEIRVVGLSVEAEGEIAEAMVHAGATACVNKAGDPAALVATVLRCARRADQGAPL